MLALVLLLAVAQAGEPTRETQVLELLRGLEQAGEGHYPSACFALVEPAFGSGAAFEARAFIFCGNSDIGSFDDQEARGLVRRLGAIFGLELEPDVERRIGDGRALLDGFDSAAGVGFELRGRRGAAREAVEEPPEDTLDEFEWRVLAGQGVRVHVDDARRFRDWDGVTFSGLVAYLSGVVAFLNEVTEGEDVELGGLRFEREARWQPAELDLRGVRISGLSKLPSAHEFRVEQAGKLLISCAGRTELLPAEDLAFGQGLAALSAEQRSWSGERRAGPSVLHLRLYAEPAESAEEVPYELPAFVVKLRQTRAGTEHVVAGVPRQTTLFLPSAIDLGEPFTLELEVARGLYRIEGARLGVSATAAAR